MSWVDEWSETMQEQEGVHHCRCGQRVRSVPKMPAPGEHVDDLAQWSREHGCSEWAHFSEDGKTRVGVECEAGGACPDWSVPEAS